MWLKSSASRLCRYLVLVTVLMIGMQCQLPSWLSAQASSGGLEERVADFFEAYNRFDGSHLDFYDQDIELEDVMAGQTLTSLAQLRQLFEQSKAYYEEVSFLVVERLIDTSSERAVVRGRVEGKLNGKDYEVGFVTWLSFRDGSIFRQVDYLDYAALQAQVVGPQ